LFRSRECPSALTEAAAGAPTCSMALMQAGLGLIRPALAGPRLALAPACPREADQDGLSNPLYGTLQPIPRTSLTARPGSRSLAWLVPAKHVHCSRPGDSPAPCSETCVSFPERPVGGAPQRLGARTGSSRATVPAGGPASSGLRDRWAGGRLRALIVTKALLFAGRVALLAHDFCLAGRAGGPSVWSSTSNGGHGSSRHPPGRA